ncbi:hypothetical protein MNEG_7674 [Monoraphidium neglectum]|uniref:EamA domain-containing protein n=1 Tax=Monoraphidium neglectum TaxID=145388 RepID=A0A0D2N235_9CHLO|nr:hypothetical protein MNEG_7674 [Monoraphidium neglectum]KIZ00286.1 hypothetical protein MNEG_7674 [Monoraphidium neglectum]|eukprot:XP_013899305.1 hypothetical protein MNEG_7674 [Monoraphidium neglectum]
MSSAIGRGASVGGLILFGTTTSLFAKIVYELESVGRDGQPKLFQKPWAMTLSMFLGMTLCLPLAYYREHRQRKEQQSKGSLSVPLIGAHQAAAPSEPPPVAKGSLKETLLLCVPSFFDLVATVLMNIGLLSVTASVYQMMRGAEMLFAAAFAVAFLHRHLNRWHGLGIAFCVIGIGLVGMSSVLGGEGSSTHQVSTPQMLFGIGLIILSQAVQAAQLTFEDFFMADLDMDPLKIVGFEGVFGSVMMIGVMMPIAYFLPGEEGTGLHEDSLDSLVMIKNSTALQGVLGTDMLALLLYNLSGMMVTGHLGAVFRTVLETMRTLFVWLVGLLLFYTPLGMGRLGEKWTAWSPLQALGFVVLVAGTLVYGKGDEAASKGDIDAAASGDRDAPAGYTREDPEAAAAPLLPGMDAAVDVQSEPTLIATGRSGPISMPVGIRSASPSQRGGSFRASMTIAQGSYRGSYTLVGSGPRGLSLDAAPGELTVRETATRRGGEGAGGVEAHST